MSRTNSDGARRVLDDARRGRSSMTEKQIQAYLAAREVVRHARLAAAGRFTSGISSETRSKHS